MTQVGFPFMVTADADGLAFTARMDTGELKMGVFKPWHLLCWSDTNLFLAVFTKLIDLVEHFGAGSLPDCGPQ